MVRDGCVSGEQQPPQVGRSSYGPLDQQEQTLLFPACTLDIQVMMTGHVGHILHFPAEVRCANVHMPSEMRPASALTRAVIRCAVHSAERDAFVSTVGTTALLNSTGESGRAVIPCCVQLPRGRWPRVERIQRARFLQGMDAWPEAMKLSGAMT